MLIQVRANEFTSFGTSFGAQAFNELIAVGNEIQPPLIDMTVSNDWEIAYQARIKDRHVSIADWCVVVLLTSRWRVS
jgi:hypothetical protein